jgi:hypothetical protein
MEKRINWLHFSDLHYGQKKQRLLMPKLKQELFKDIELLKNELGKFDVVFFTGDLTQAGHADEFDELTVFLKELWALFNKLGCNPFFVAIPGNHDLLRQDKTGAAIKLLKTYNTDSETQDLFWNSLNKGDEYYELVHQCFKNFTLWYANVNLPKPTLQYGLIPGDISGSLDINNFKLRFVGLNTAFLELTNDEYRGKLAINTEQVYQLTNKDPLKWIKECDVALLLTHHDPSWLDEKSKAAYNSDINPSDAFYNHFCGHLHEANAFQYGQIGSGKRRIQLAPSLFGLQMINDTEDRIHGYYAGCYTIENSEIVEYFYPRKVNKKYSGDYSINPDFGFELNSDNCVITRSSHASFELSTKKEQDKGNQTSIIEDSLKNEAAEHQNNVLDIASTAKNLKRLEKVPKASYLPTPQHSSIRLVEQRNFIQK